MIKLINCQLCGARLDEEQNRTAVMMILQKRRNETLNMFCVILGRMTTDERANAWLIHRLDADRRHRALSSHSTDYAPMDLVFLIYILHFSYSFLHPKLAAVCRLHAGTSGTTYTAHSLLILVQTRARAGDNGFGEEIKNKKNQNEAIIAWTWTHTTCVSEFKIANANGGIVKRQAHRALATHSFICLCIHLVCALARNQWAEPKC